MSIRTLLIPANRRFRVHGTVIQLFVTLCLLSTHAAGQQTQAQAQAQLTTKTLIGQAVSLSNTSYPDVDNAIQRFRNGDVEGAAVFLEKARAKHPKLPPVGIMMAKMQSIARNSAAVRISLERTVIDHPNDPEAYLHLADQAFSSGRTVEAEALFEKAEVLTQQFDENAKRKRSFNIRTLAGRAAVAERWRQWDQAIALLEKWVEIDPENTAARQRYGIVLFRLVKTAEALQQFSKARELNPDSPHPYVLVGKLFAQKRDAESNERAREAFERAYAEEPSGASTAQAYAEWLIQDDKLEKAAQVSADLLKQSPDSLVALILDSVISFMNGKSDKAEKSLLKVLSLDPSNAAATNLMAQLLVERDDTSAKDRALRYAQANAKLFPNSSQSNITLAWVLYKEGRTREAEAALQKGVQGRNFSLDSTYLVAKILSELNQTKAAKRALLQAMNQNGLFIYRKQAEQLLAKLQAESP